MRREERPSAARLLWFPLGKSVSLCAGFGSLGACAPPYSWLPFQGELSCRAIMPCETEGRSCSLLPLPYAFSLAISITSQMRCRSSAL